MVRVALALLLSLILPAAAGASLVGSPITVSNSAGHVQHDAAWRPDGCVRVVAPAGQDACRIEDTAVLDDYIGVELRPGSVLFRFVDFGGRAMPSFQWSRAPPRFEVTVSGLVWQGDPAIGLGEIVPGPLDILGRRIKGGASVARSGADAITLSFDDLVIDRCTGTVCAMLEVAVAPPAVAPPHGAGDVAAVPLPGAMALLAAGLAALALPRRGSRAKRHFPSPKKGLGRRSCSPSSSRPSPSSA